MPGDETARQTLEGRLRQRREERHAAQEVDLGRRPGRGHVDAHERAPGKDGDDGEEDARHEQRRARADALDERRGDHGPERRRAQEDAVQDPEDPGKHGIRHRPLEEREAGDVHHGVREADDAEQDERPAAAVPRAARAIGTPQSAVPRPKARPSRRLPMRAMAPTAPSTPPTPSAAFSEPSPASPMPSTSSASTTTSTLRAPATSVCAAKRPTRTRTRESEPMA